jgi:hypothetical protein
MKSANYSLPLFSALADEVLVLPEPNNADVTAW